MTAGAGLCEYCGEVVPLRQAAYRIVGWEVVRGAGGANRILGRKRLGTVAHRLCAESAERRERLGLTEQGSLLDE